MIRKALLEDVLQKALSTGADFAEVYVEYTKSNGVSMLGGKVELIGDNVLSGVGIRVYIGLRSVYASTNDLSRDGLLDCAGRVADVAAQSSKQVNINLTERIFGDIHRIREVPDTVAKRAKIDVLRAASEAAYAHSDDISQV